MIKKFSKILFFVLLVFIISSSSFICLADEVTNTVTTTQTNEETNTTHNHTTEEVEVHNGDLYIFDNDIVMNKYVNGNVFIFGNNVEITGQVNGNLFVFANNITFNESVVRYSIFACANSVYYNGGCGTYQDYGNLYVAATKFETTFNSYVTGDIKSVASNIILKAAIHRDADLICNTIDFGSGEDVPIIYGNLKYTASNEISIPDGVLAGDTSTATYTKQNVSSSVTDTLIGFGACVVTALALYIILNKLTPKFIEKVYDNKFSILSLLKAFGIGLATIAIVLVFIVLLAGTMVGISLAVILALLFTILCIIATPILTIKIANALKPALKIEKVSLFYLVIALVSIILHGITLIPFVGLLLSLIIKVTAIGLIVNMFLPHKELSSEEKLALEEAKKQTKENKEKRKQEKQDAKTTEKEKKSKIKETKKDEKVKEEKVKETKKKDTRKKDTKETK